MKLTIELRHQWQFLYQKCCWYDFNFIKLFIEDDRMFNNFEAEAWLLGFGVVLVWNYRENSKGKELANKITDW